MKLLLIIFFSIFLSACTLNKSKIFQKEIPILTDEIPQTTDLMTAVKELLNIDEDNNLSEIKLEPVFNGPTIDGTGFFIVDSLDSPKLENKINLIKEFFQKNGYTIEENFKPELPVVYFNLFNKKASICTLSKINQRQHDTTRLEFGCNITKSEEE